MKATDLWKDEEYAYLADRPRGVETPSGAIRVKVLGTYRRKVGWNERLSAFATVVFLDKETGAETDVQRDVRARDIVDFWDDYSDRRNSILQRREAMVAEEERIKAEKKRELDHVKSRFSFRTGIPASIVEVDDYTITIDRRKYVEWLRNGNG